MLTFQSVSETGYTVVRPDGSTTVVTTSYNNDANDAFLHYDGLDEYEFNSLYTTFRGKSFVVHTQHAATSEWIIKHNIDGIPMVTTEVEHESELTPILPYTVEMVDDATIRVTFTSDRLGTARLK